MTLFINGEAFEFDAPKNIKEILETLGVEEKIFAITLNSALVARESYQSTIPNNGDKLELLQFMGGG